MLRWTLVFFVFSLIAGVLGFGGLAEASAEMARIVFFIFIALCFFSLLGGMLRGDRKGLKL